MNLGLNPLPVSDILRASKKSFPLLVSVGLFHEMSGEFQRICSLFWGPLRLISQYPSKTELRMHISSNFRAQFRVNPCRFRRFTVNFQNSLHLRLNVAEAMTLLQQREPLLTQMLSSAKEDHAPAEKPQEQTARGTGSSSRSSLTGARRPRYGRRGDSSIVDKMLT